MELQQYGTLQKLYNDSTLSSDSPKMPDGGNKNMMLFVVGGILLVVVIGGIIYFQKKEKIGDKEKEKEGRDN